VNLFKNLASDNYEPDAFLKSQINYATIISAKNRDHY